MACMWRRVFSPVTPNGGIVRDADTGISVISTSTSARTTSSSSTTPGHFGKGSDGNVRFTPSFQAGLALHENYRALLA